MGVAQHRQRLGDGAEPLPPAGVSAGAGRQFFGNAKGVQPAEPLVVLEQGGVLDGEQRPPQGGEHGELVVGVLHRGQGRAHGRHFFPVVERPTAHEEMRQVAGLQGLDVGAGHVDPEALETPEQDADMPRGHRRPPRRPGAAARRRRPPFRHPPAALFDQPMDERADRVGQRTVDGGGGDPPLAVGARNRQHDDAGLRVGVVPKRRQGHVVGLVRARSARRGRGTGHQRREGPVHETLDAGHAAEAGGQGQGRHAGGLQLALHLPVHADVRPPEPVDRLLGVADDEQLARRRPNPAPVPLGRVAGRQQQDDLRLQGVGVLELVDEDAGEAPLEVGADRVVVAHQIARLDQQVDEVEAAGVALEVAEGFDRRLQLVAQARGQMRIRDPLEVLQHVHDPAMPIEHRLPVDALAVAGPRPLQGLGELAVPGQFD